MKVNVMNFTENPEFYIAKAASISHDSEITKDNYEKLIIKLLEWKHMTPFEFANVSFHVSDITRVCSHQLVRHRIGVSIVQKSQRYTNIDRLSIDNSFLPYIHVDDTENISKLSDKYNEIYDIIKESKLSKEDKRFFYPQFVKTEMNIRFNYRSLIHFMKLRLDSSAQHEIRNVSYMMLEEIKEIAPIVYGHIRKNYA